MIKGTKCEYCEERIEFDPVVLEYEGQNYYFHDREELMEWVEEKLEPFIYYNDVVEEW